VDPQKQKKPMLEKVGDWLQEQGYPLEFRTAAAFQAMGINASQGLYVQQENDGSARELDIVASMRGGLDKILIEISTVIECKWSRDKPWVVFTAPGTIMAPSACIAQTISSALGGALTYSLAGNENLHKFEIFASSERNGFGGRRAFSGEKDQDQFYSTVQSIVSKTIAYAKRFDENREPGQMPKYCCLAFPMIVLEGELFEAHFDPAISDVQLCPVESIRLHWRGAEKPGHWISTVDIVRFDSLGSLVSRRKMEWEQLMSEVHAILPSLSRCFQKRSLKFLEVRPAPRGYVGLPKLLYELRNLGKRRPQLSAKNK
jgi:hypothetical protein